MLRTFASALVFICSLCAPAMAQVAAPSSGDITIRLSQPFDSAVARPNQLATGTVVRSTNPSVPPGSAAGVLLRADQAGFTIHLVRLSIGGQLLRTESADGVLAGVSKLGGFLHEANTPKTSAAGPRVFLPASTDVRFTLTEAPAQPAPPPSRVARAPVPPPPPRHPANDMLDVPPAAPGYPPMRATHPAEPGCWWIPYVSAKWGFEAPLQTCEKKDNDIKVVETKTGLAIILHDAPDSQGDFLTVETKPAAQPIETAVQQQFILKLKVPAARTSCKVQKQDSVGSAESYSVQATGSYSRLKKFQADDGPDSGEEACPGLQSSDNVATYFLYLPNESKTHFFFINELDYGSLFDHSAMRYATPQ